MKKLLLSMLCVGLLAGTTSKTEINTLGESIDEINKTIVKNVPFIFATIYAGLAGLFIYACGYSNAQIDAENEKNQDEQKKINSKVQNIEEILNLN